jgi:hypothetical protein
MKVWMGRDGLVKGRLVGWLWKKGMLEELLREFDRVLFCSLRGKRGNDGLVVEGDGMKDWLCRERVCDGLDVDGMMYWLWGERGDGGLVV